MSSFRFKIEYRAVLLIAWFMRSMPLGLSRSVAAILGWTGANIIGLRRSVALDNLKHAFPEKSDCELRRIYSRCWIHFFKVGAEMARMPRMNESFIERWIDLSQHTVIKEALNGGRGAIVVSGHFGNWEWMGGSMSRIGYAVTYVVTSQTNRLVEDWMNRMRKSAGVEIVHRRNAVKGVLSALKRNRAVAILCDQDAGGSGVFVPFFNRLASTPRGPAVFHLKTGVPIVFSAAHRDYNGRLMVTFEEMKFNGLTGDRGNDERTIMQSVTARLEDGIRLHPEQWLWLHRRWKSKPPAE